VTWPARWPHPALIFVIFAWGINFPMVKIVYSNGFNPPAAALLRYLATVPLMFLATAMLGRSFALPKKFWPGVAIGGLLASGVYMAFFLYGLQRTSASQGAIALATAPLWVTLLSSLAGHEKVSARVFGGGAIAFLGVAVAEIGSHGIGDGTLPGTLLCVAGAMVWAISVVFLRPAINECDPMAVFTWSLLPASLVLVPFGWIGLRDLNWAAVTPAGWWSTLYLGLVSGVMGFTAYYIGIARAGAAKTSMVSYVIPIVAAFASWPILQVAPHPSHLLGLVFVLLGVAVATRKAHVAAAAPESTQERTPEDSKMEGQ
jgi:drug/metabolite transporter (DMT)-like permease